MSESETPLPSSSPREETSQPRTDAEDARTRDPGTDGDSTGTDSPAGDDTTSAGADAGAETEADAGAETDAEAEAETETETDGDSTSGADTSAPGGTAPTPTAPRPGPPASGVPSPAVLAGRRPAAALIPVVPPVAEYDEEAISRAKTFGAVAEDGTVTVRDGTQVRTIGTVEPGSAPDTALEPFARAYLDLAAFLDLTEKKLAAPEHTQNELNRLLENLRKNMKEPQVAGDIPALRARAHDLREQAKDKIRQLESRRAEARSEATRRRTEFVESIEQLAATDAEQISWKSAGETMRRMVPDWKQMQTSDVSLDRATEDALWKRLSAARSTFDRKRRQFFSQLDEKHAEAARIKEDLIARAEAMQDSTDWGPTVRAFKDLMNEWRSAPRGSRKKDDAQWARFKAAQDRFFDARNADLRATETEQRANLEVKEALLTEAEAIDPGKDLDAAKESLRGIQDRWESAGKVPRHDLRRVEDRLRKVERSIAQAEQDEWRRTDPRTRARVEGASSQLHSAIAEYEEALEKARAGGDPKRIAEAEAALEARKEWLAVIERSARDLG